jgi:hypothetical protein
MSVRLKVAAAAVVVALSVTPAFAELLNFSWEYAPGEVATWSQPSDPTPVFFETDTLTRVAVSGGTTTSSGPFSTVNFESDEDENGGIEILLTTSSIESIGVQIYTGPEDAPIFSPGRYSILTEGSEDVSFVVVTAAVPEASTWAMMLIGFAGLGYAAVRRKSAPRAIAA